MIRPCPVCNSDQKTILYTQHFSTVSEYNVVACQDCGFTYADNINDQKRLDQYYREQPKYNHVATDQEVNQFKDLAQNLALRYLDRNISILEIGCANGGLLNELKNFGFTNLKGLDPYPGCASNPYGIEVMTGTISELPHVSYDLIILVAVLEHVANLPLSLAKIRNATAGNVFVEVPDATRYKYPDSQYAPFMEFSVEHINYFTPVSLCNLIRTRGFSVVSLWRHHYPNGDHVLRAVFKKNIYFDKVPSGKLQEYIEESGKAERRVLAIIKKLEKSQVPVLIWGIGAHTQKYLVQIMKLNIVAFVVSDPTEAFYEGKRILSPHEIMEEPILISSRAAQASIVSQIHELELKNEVITLYD